MKTKFSEIWNVVTDSLWFSRINKKEVKVKTLYKDMYIGLTEDQRKELLELEKENNDLLYKYGNTDNNKTGDVVAYRDRLDSFFKSLLPKEKR